MTYELARAYDGQFVVIETEDDHYLGTITVDREAVTVHTGFVGRPPVVPVADIESIVPAEQHPLVSVAA